VTIAIEAGDMALARSARYGEPTDTYTWDRVALAILANLVQAGRLLPPGPPTQYEREAVAVAALTIREAYRAELAHVRVELEAGDATNG